MSYQESKQRVEDALKEYSQRMAMMRFYRAMLPETLRKEIIFERYMDPFKLRVRLKVNRLGWPADKAIILNCKPDGEPPEEFVALVCTAFT